MFPVSLVITQCLTIEPCALFVCLTSAKTSVLDCWPFCWLVLPLILEAIADDLASKHMAIGCQAWIRLVHSWRHIHSTKIHLFQSSKSWIWYNSLLGIRTFIDYLKKKRVWACWNLYWCRLTFRIHELSYFAKNHAISFPCLFWCVSLFVFSLWSMFGISVFLH